MRAGDLHTSVGRCVVRLLPEGTFLGDFNLIETFEPLEVLPSITVPAGTYAPAIRVRQTSTKSNEVESNDVVLVPGIGIVRRFSESTTGTRLHELTDGTVNGQSVKR
jgi:hypothetical protein